MKKYVPCWSERCNELLREYRQTQSPETADQLLDALSEERRRRWTRVTEQMDFRRSGRHAWQLLKKLDPDKTEPKKTKAQISADEVAKQIKQRSIRQPVHEFERQARREYQRLFNECPDRDDTISAPISKHEIYAALQTVKAGKASGADGIYPDMLKRLGKHSIEWLSRTFSDVLETGKCPRDWKRTIVLAILKPGKPAERADSYRPIALLCCIFKLLERVILMRISPVVDQAIPTEQAGFRPKRDTTEQIVGLTSYIEAGFEEGYKVGAVFVDLSAAYDSVWRDGLLLKLARIIKCKTMLKLLSNMTGTRYFKTILSDDKGKWREIANGVPQGSVLAPTLFNVYISDMPETTSIKLGYADDWAIATRARGKVQLEETLTRDMQQIERYFRQWYLTVNTTKTVSSYFHLNNREAEDTLSIRSLNNQLPSDQFPMYLGVTLDRSLSYKKHIGNVMQKLKKRTNLIRKISGTSWGAPQAVLRTSAMALCYSVAEYAAPAWARSCHARKVDVSLNETMRMISGTLRSTPREWLPVMSNIEPPHLRREAATQRKIRQILDLDRDNHARKILENGPQTSRLKSRRPIYKAIKQDYDIHEKWKQEWALATPRGGERVRDPCLP